ncbi:MAG: hypothetical protein ACR2PT_13990 [Endozoicomonas sp.]
MKYRNCSLLLGFMFIMDVSYAVLPADYAACFDVNLLYSAREETLKSLDEMIDDGSFLESQGFVRTWEQTIGQAELSLFKPPNSQLHRYTMTTTPLLPEAPRSTHHSSAALAHEIGGIEGLRSQLCPPSFESMNIVNRDVSPLTAWLCQPKVLFIGVFDSLDIGSVMHKLEAGTRYVVYQKENDSGYKAKVEKQKSGEKITLFEEERRYPVKITNIPAVFLSGELLEGAGLSGNYYILASFLTHINYIPVQLETCSKAVMIETDEGHTEPEAVKEFTFSYSLDFDDKHFITASYDQYAPVLFRAEIFTAGRYRGQLYSMAIRFLIENLQSIEGSGYIEIIYKRQFKPSQQKTPALERLKRPLSTHRDSGNVIKTLVSERLYSH